MAVAQRGTQQRRAIRQVLEEGGRPLAPGEIRERAAVHAPGLGIATVYRTLAHLESEGRVHSVDVPGVPGVRWEVTGKGHHHHFHCRRCDGLFEVADCPGPLRDLAPAGFLVETHEIVLFGLCPACQPAAG
jgi:Fur family ferric uptake transcriptional regulator